MFWVCAGMHGCVWKSAEVHECLRVCVLDEFSEYLLETRVNASADFNTYPIRIFIFQISISYLRFHKPLSSFKKSQFWKCNSCPNCCAPHHLTKRTSDHKFYRSNFFPLSSARLDGDHTLRSCNQKPSQKNFRLNQSSKKLGRLSIVKSMQ